jgi:hypothetical protein
LCSPGGLGIRGTSKVKKSNVKAQGSSETERLNDNLYQKRKNLNAAIWHLDFDI